MINFGAMPLEEAEAWPDLISILHEKVKPERDKVRRDAHRKYWWHYGDKRPALYTALAPLSRCLVTSCVSKHLIFSFQPKDRIFSHSLYVFPTESWARFAVLQSRIHEVWARLLSSTLEDRLRYAASDCFDTFPFPVSPSHLDPAPEEMGRILYTERAECMEERGIGLTDLYNELKDPDCDYCEIDHLRLLHEELDRVVLSAYGWDDLTVPPYEVTDEKFNLEVIDRLYELNLKRSSPSQEEKPSLGLDLFDLIDSVEG